MTYYWSGSVIFDLIIYDESAFYSWAYIAMGSLQIWVLWLIIMGMRVMLVVILNWQPSQGRRKAMAGPLFSQNGPQSIYFSKIFQGEYHSRTTSITAGPLLLGLHLILAEWYDHTS